MDKEKIQMDHLNSHPEWKVYQHKDMFKINTDTTLLGEFLTVSASDSILDVGTNNGALLLYCAMKGATDLTGIELNQEAIEIAQMTLKQNHLTAHLIAGDFRSFQSAKKFDVIITNPPYFVMKSDKVRCHNPYRLYAKDEAYLPLTALLGGVFRNLKENGRFFMIHRPDRLSEIQKEMADHQLYICHLRYVYDGRRKDPIALLIQAKKNPCEEMIKDFIVI